MRDLLGADIEDHIAVFRGRSAVPALEEIGHHDTDLAPLAAEHLLQLLGIDRVGTLGLGVVLDGWCGRTLCRSSSLGVDKLPLWQAHTNVPPSRAFRVISEQSIGWPPDPRLYPGSS